MGVVGNLKTLLSGKPATSPPVKPTTTPKTILVVEDDALMRNFYVDLLTRHGYTVLKAVNGQEGLDTIVSQKPDLVLLDLMMPVMDGKTMLHKLRQIPDFTILPVIVLTNAGDEESMRATQLYDNANGFLIKSNVDPNEIVMRIQALL